MSFSEQKWLFKPRAFAEPHYRTALRSPDSPDSSAPFGTPAAPATCHFQRQLGRAAALFCEARPSLDRVTHLEIDFRGGSDGQPVTNLRQALFMEVLELAR